MIVQHSSQDQILNGCRLGVWVTGLMPTASGYESKQQQSPISRVSGHEHPALTGSDTDTKTKISVY